MVIEVSLFAYLQKVNKQYLKKLIFKAFTVGICVLHHQENMLKKINHDIGIILMIGLQEKFLLQDKM